MNNDQFEHIKLFLNKCKIPVSNFEDLNGMIIPRDVLLDKTIYDSIKEDISILKQIFKSSFLTALQSTAENNQKWPLLNLVRQILKSCGYKMEPKRLCKGYTKEGKKLFERVFTIDLIKKTQTVVAEDLTSLSLDSSL